MHKLQDSTVIITDMKLTQKYSQSLHLTEKYSQSLHLTQKYSQSLHLTQEYSQSLHLTQKYSQSLQLTRETLNISFLLLSKNIEPELSKKGKEMEGRQ